MNKFNKQSQQGATIWVVLCLTMISAGVSLQVLSMVIDQNKSLEREVRAFQERVATVGQYVEPSTVDEKGS